jgi:hypothetical protein
MNRWLGYSERGLAGAWLQDLCGRENAPNAPLEFLQTGDCPDPLAAALAQSNALTTVVEPGFAGFGNPDGLIIAETHHGNERQATALMLVEGKRGPLATEWNGDIGDPGTPWKSSHLVVQTARGAAFLHKLAHRDPVLDATNEILFSANWDHWRREGNNVRTMKLKKTSLVQFLDNSGACGDIPSANITLTSSAWPYGNPPAVPALELLGTDAFGDVLDCWEVDCVPIQLGFEFLLEHQNDYRLFWETFRFCEWDTLGKQLAWATWLTHAEAAFGHDSLARVDQWAMQRGGLAAPIRGDAERFMYVGHPPARVARLFGCYGPGGPILDLQIHQHHGEPALPDGWTWWPWSAALGAPPIDDTTWQHQYLVPEP